MGYNMNAATESFTEVVPSVAGERYPLERPSTRMYTSEMAKKDRRRKSGWNVHMSDKGSIYWPVCPTQSIVDKTRYQCVTDRSLWLCGWLGWAWLEATTLMWLSHIMWRRIRVASPSLTLGSTQLYHSSTRCTDNNPLFPNVYIFLVWWALN